MIIRFIGHATFEIILSDGRKILIDPYMGKSFQGRFNYPTYEAACDFAVITHEHPDHNYLGGMRNIPVVVRQGWVDDGLKIRSIFAYHDKFEGKKFGGYVLMKVIEAEGIRLGHLGDVGEILTDDQIGALGRLDILILPVGGFYTVDGDEAYGLAERIGAGVTIPCHYRTPSCSLPIEDASRFLSHYPESQKILGSSVLHTQLQRGVYIFEDYAAH